MSKLRQIIVLSLCLASVATWGQNRFSTSSQAERKLSKVKGFSAKETHKSKNSIGLHSAVYTGAGHYLGFSVDGGWSTFLSNIQGVQSTPGGWAANGKFLYEFHIGNFFLQTGVGAGIQHVTTPIRSENVSESASVIYTDVTDPYDGKPFRMKHVFGDRTDMSELYYAQLPINFGYYISGQGGVGYVMLGAQVNYAFGGKTRATAICSSSAVSNEYMGVFEEMDNHGFRKDVPISADGGKLPIRLGNTSVLNLDILGHLEGGYEFNTFEYIQPYRTSSADTDFRLRIAAFMDISLPSINPRGENKLYDLNGSLYDFQLFKMNHVFTTDIANSNQLWVRSLTVGVRVTLLFSLQAQQRCILCDSWRH